MKCEKCGKENRSNARYCTNCGSLLTSQNDLAKLVISARKGDQTAIAGLYDMTRKKYMNICRQILQGTGAANDMEDVLQEAYIKMFSNLDKLQNPENFVAWGGRIVSNTALDLLRKNRPVLLEENMGMDEIDYEPMFINPGVETNPEQAIEQKETSRLVSDMIGELSEDQRLCIYLFYMQEMSVKEIANQTGVNENTVKSRLKYGRDNIEKKVLLLEKQGTSLRGFAPLPFFVWLYRKSLISAEASEAVKSSVRSSIIHKGLQASAKGTRAASASGKTGLVGRGVLASGKTGLIGSGISASGKALGIKIAAGLLTAGIAVAGVHSFRRTKNTNDQIKNPVITEDAEMYAGKRTVWDCIYFGEYPQEEIFADDPVYPELENAAWDDQNDTILNGVRYRRVLLNTFDEERFENELFYFGEEAYFYFRFDPIKWRVLNTDGEEALLVSDLVLETGPYDIDDQDEWKDCSLRAWLNGDKDNVDPYLKEKGTFWDIAFSEQEKAGILRTSLASYGGETEDCVFILSGEMATSTAEKTAGYGFSGTTDIHDEGAMADASRYVHHQCYHTEDWYSMRDEDRINFEWWIRGWFLESEGIEDLNAFGNEIDNTGYLAACNTNYRYGGIRPAITLSLDDAGFSYAGQVDSTDMHELFVLGLLEAD